MSKITPCLWFDGQAEEAASFYVSLLSDSHVDQVVRSPSDTPSGPEGSVLLVEFTLAGQQFTALNGGPQFRFNESVSFVIDCADQQEVDRLWEELSANEAAEQCGWLKDRFGLSWQIIPSALPRLLSDPDAAKANRVMNAMLGMKKIDIAELERAGAGIASPH
jgi:predicted 3-demethylubiquinone-9 3-methyltransferase (glyoxalase superfamily)